MYEEKPVAPAPGIGEDSVVISNFIAGLHRPADQLPVSMEISPVVVFCYNRPWHLSQTIDALKANTLAGESSLYVFSDGSKGESDREDVLSVRKYIAGIGGFKRITVFEADRNKGLSRSVIDGVTQVINAYGRAIVLEDDMVTTPDFLAYMNHLLDVYEGRKDVFSVTAYAPPIRIPVDYKNEFYLAPRSSSWGWGTWKDRWEQADWSAAGYERLKADPDLKRRFLSGGNDLWPMLHKQQLGVIDSWAVRWCLSQALKGAYGVYPVKSKLRNIGTDGSGTNFTFSTGAYDVPLNENKPEADPGLQPEEQVMEAFRDFYALPFYLKVKNLLKYGLWE